MPGPMMGPMMNGHPVPGDPTAFAMPNLILPGMNDSPLEFNMNKNKPPMPVTLETNRGKEDTPKCGSPSDRNRRRGEKRDRQNDRERREDRERRDDKEKENGGSKTNATTSDTLNTQPPAMNPNMWGSVMGMGYPVMGMNMIVDPNMMGMNNYGMMQPIMAADGSIMQQVNNNFFVYLCLYPNKCELF